MFVFAFEIILGYALKTFITISINIKSKETKNFTCDDQADTDAMYIEKFRVGFLQEYN